MRSSKRRRVGIYGWGVVAPRSPDVESFARNLESAESWLSPFDGFGRDSFLVGEPAFDLEAYRSWIEERFPPRRYAQITDKLGAPTHYALGAFIQAVSQCPGLEEELRRLGEAARVYVGTGVGDLETIRRASLELEKAQRAWDRFWADPARNAALERHLGGELDPAAPLAPEEAPPDEREAVEERWSRYWAERSPELGEYLEELREIEGRDVEGEVERGKKAAIRRKRILGARLRSKWGAPEPPWESVPAELIWNIHNGPAAQVSMIGGITGLAFAPVAACSTFGVALRLAVDAIALGDAKVVVVGATDPPPSPLLVGAFYKARVISADGAVSKPLSGLRGTHIAGGSAVWIVADVEHMRERGFRPIGLEPLAVGVSSDADHVITPSREGPTAAIRQALATAGVAPAEVRSWDLHATATPGDLTEVETLRGVLPESVLVTARKGTFGHGMSAGGGWELMAQYLGLVSGRLLPTPLGEAELNPHIAEVHRRFVLDRACAVGGGGIAGKLSMGIGGINACVLSRPWEDALLEDLAPPE